MNKKPPQVSIILPTYNRAHLVGRSIQSILVQSYEDFELIVVDDASSDNTKEVVKGMHDPRIRYITYQVNRGASYARNVGIKEAKGIYIAFQDSDDEWMTQKLEKQMEIFVTAPDDVGVVYCDMIKINEKESRERYWHSPLVIDGRLIHPETLDYQVARLGIVSAIIKKECFETIGLFDESMSKYEDLDLFIRLSKKYRFIHLPTPLVKYYDTIGISSNTDTEVTAQEILLEKHYRGIESNREFLSKQYFDLGVYLWNNGQTKEGRKYFVNAVKQDPFNMRYLRICMVSFIGRKGYEMINSYYQKLKNIFS